MWRPAVDADEGRVAEVLIGGDVTVTDAKNAREDSPAPAASAAIEEREAA
jgi:hypothetical protein